MLVGEFFNMLTLDLELPAHLALGNSLHPPLDQTWHTGTSGEQHTLQPREAVLDQSFHLGVVSLFGARWFCKLVCFVFSMKFQGHLIPCLCLSLCVHTQGNKMEFDVKH